MRPGCHWPDANRGVGRGVEARATGPNMTPGPTSSLLCLVLHSIAQHGTDAVRSCRARRRVHRQPASHDLLLLSSSNPEMRLCGHPGTWQMVPAALRCDCAAQDLSSSTLPRCLRISRDGWQRSSSSLVSMNPDIARPFHILCSPTFTLQSHGQTAAKAKSKHALYHPYTRARIGLKSCWTCRFFSFLRSQPR
jgi:hypothetical protein